MPFAVPGQHLRDYTIGYIAQRCWMLQAKCACGHVAHWRAADLPRLPQAATVGEFADRLKCSACGGHDGAVSCLDDSSVRHTRQMEKFEDDVAAGRRATFAPETKKPPAS